MLLKLCWYSFTLSWVYKHVITILSTRGESHWLITACKITIRTERCTSSSLIIKCQTDLLHEVMHCFTLRKQLLGPYDDTAPQKSRNFVCRVLTHCTVCNRASWNRIQSPNIPITSGYNSIKTENLINPITLKPYYPNPHKFKNPITL